MIQPTDKQKNEAREIVIAFSRCPEDWDALTAEFAAALSSRDQEIREVLEGLRDDNCFDACFLRWMKRYEDPSGFQHSDACLATQRLWERVRGIVNEEESDVVK